MFCLSSKRGRSPQFLLRSRRSRGSLWSHVVHVMVMMMVVVMMMMVHRHRLGGYRRRPGGAPVIVDCASAYPLRPSDKIAAAARVLIMGGLSCG